MTKKYNKTNIAGVAIVLASLGLGLGCGAHKEDMSKPPEPKPIVDPIKPPPKELVVEPIELPELPIKDPISKDEPIVVEPPIKPVVYDDIEVKPQPIITEQSAELTSLEGKLATLPELAKYQSKGMQEAIPLLKTVVDKFVLLKDNSPDVCTNKYGLTQNLKQLRKLCDQELRRVGLLPDDYHSTDVSEHPIFVYSKEETEAVSLTILTQALTKAHEAGDYGLLHQKDTKALPKYLDALLNSYRDCGWFTQCHFDKYPTPYQLAAITVATIALSVMG